LLLAVVLAGCAVEPEPEPWYPKYLDNPIEFPLGEVTTLPDAKLRSAIEFLALEQPLHERGKLDRCLAETLRRGRQWEPFLERTLERTQKLGGYFRSDLDILTALHRSRSEPDPLMVRVEGDVEATFPEMPVVRVKLVNVSRRPFVVTGAGDMLGRFRLSVRDGKGTPVPGRIPPCRTGISFAWGRYSLYPGGAWGSMPDGRYEIHDARAGFVDLPTRDYVDLPGPGRYSVVVEYRDLGGCGMEQADADAIVFRSVPITLVWKPLVVRLSATTRKRIRESVAELYQQSRTPVFDRVWNPDMVFAGEPGSPAEAIYRHGHAALPVLLEELERVSDRRRRAHLFAMLASLTGFGVTPYPGYDYGPWTELAVAERDGITEVRTGRSGRGRRWRRPQEWLSNLWQRCASMVQVEGV